MANKIFKTSIGEILQEIWVLYSKCPTDLLKNEDNGVDKLDKWLAMFVLEVWKSNGTVSGFLAGIQRYMKEKRPVSVQKKLSRNDSSFVKLMNALDRQL